MAWRQFLSNYFKRCLNERAQICGKTNFHNAKMILEDLLVTWTVSLRNSEQNWRLVIRRSKKIRQPGWYRMPDYIWFPFLTSIADQRLSVAINFAEIFSYTNISVILFWKDNSSGSIIFQFWRPIFTLRKNMNKNIRPIRFPKN